MSIRLSALMGPGFAASHRAVRAGTVTELIEKGGRGSGKSSYLSVELVLQLLRHPDCHAVVVRKVANTLRTSVYPQLQWAVEQLGLRHLFRCSLSPLELEYIPTGQRIWFFGTDDPGKLKSVKPPFGYVGICWFEELDQFDSAEEIRSVEQSVFRGGSYSLSLKSFNPPPSPAHWVNLMALESKPGRLTHHSTYRELPQDWLGSRFLTDASHLRATSPKQYDHEYLGIPTGVGDSVFGNLRIEPICEETLSRFDRVCSGIDWGWWPDPFAFNRVHYDARCRTLYIFDELTLHRTGNCDAAQAVRQRVTRNEPITADSAEPKSIADFRAAGLRCSPAQKGAGSVNQSMKWLQSLNAIVIDPGRCPDTAGEFSRCSYERDRSGRTLPGYPDRDNHHIDAVRYATDRLWRRREA